MVNGCSDGVFMGNLFGIVMFGVGKIVCVMEWFVQCGQCMMDFLCIVFYSDLCNDLLLFEVVLYLVVVSFDIIL